MKYDETKPVEVEVELESPLNFCEQHNYDIPLPDFIKSLQNVLDSAPDEAKGKIMFSLNQPGDQYDGYYPVEHSIYYSRLETQDEVQKRIDQNRQWELDRIKIVELELERLKENLNSS